jgi:ferritin-like metal-binding protein YciE
MITLQDLFLQKLAEMHDAERQVVRALPKLALVATSPDLTRAILSRIQESELHQTTLDRVFECFGATARSTPCEATSGLLAEGDKIAATFRGSPSINEAIIATAQRIQQYAIASYDRLCEWAAMLGNTKAGSLLHELLEGKKASSERLSKLARDNGVPQTPGEPVKAKSPAVTPRDSDKPKTFPSHLKRPPQTRRFGLPPTAPQP